MLSFQDFNSRFERNIFNQHLRRARQAGLPATLTMEDWYENVYHFQGKCAYCQMKPYAVLEHYISLSSGCGTTADNCVPACQSCNVRKYQGSLDKSALQRVERYLATLRNEVQE